MRNKRKKVNFIKRIVIVLVTLILFIIGSRQAFHQRGYDAVGGEIFLLLLPAAYYAVEQMVRDIKEEIGG